MAKVVSRSKKRSKTLTKNRNKSLASKPKPRAPAKMTARRKVVSPAVDLAYFKRRLMLERQRIADGRERIRSRAQQAEGTLPADETWEADEDSGDISASMFEKEINVSLEKELEGMLESVEAALLKIKNKTYGVCDMCNRPIGKLRLERIPFATLCVACQSLMEGM